jgi:hypothetical protein
MMLPEIAHPQIGDLVWLDASLDKGYVQKFCQAPRKMPGYRAGFSRYTLWGTERHFVILLEKDFSLQKISQSVNDFDVKVLSPVLGVFWVPCNYLLTLDEYNQFLLESQEKEKKAKKNKKKNATK